MIGGPAHDRQTQTLSNSLSPRLKKINKSNSLSPRDKSSFPPPLPPLPFLRLPRLRSPPPPPSAAPPPDLARMPAADHTMEEGSAVQRGAAWRRGNTIRRPQMAPLDTQRRAADASFCRHGTYAQVFFSPWLCVLYLPICVFWRVSQICYRFCDFVHSV